MKKLMQFIITLCAAVLLGVTTLHAAENQGVYVTVELVSGATQNAHFLGIEQDTVSLGGTIQGKFTVLRIAKDRFKSITDEKGNDLLNGDTGKADPNTDSSTVSSIDTTAADSVEEPRQPTFLDSVEGKHIYLALERRSIDSILDVQVSALIVRLLKESGTPVTLAKRTDFGYCRESSCIKDSLKQYGASSVYQGSILAGASQDSLILQMSHFNLKDSTDKATSAKISLSAINSLTDALGNNKLNHFVKLLQGDSIPKQVAEVKQGPSYIKVDSDPEGASIIIPGKEDICKTPCAFAVADTGKVDVYAYWNVNDQLWGNKSTLRPIPHDTTKISVKLKKVRPELRVFTIPEGAYIYAGSAPLSPSSEHIGKSPDKFPIYSPGNSYIQIRKEGYRDTLVTFFASPTEITDVSVTLHPITNPAEIAQQEEWLKNRRKNFIGKALMGSSIAPIIAGALVTYLGYRNYDDAQKIKDDLKKPASFNGANYQAKVQENHDLVHRGDRKIIVGGSLIGAGVLMLGAGILLTF